MQKFNILFLSSDKYPPFRVDVKVLFGIELSRRKHKIDMVLQAQEDCRRSFVTRWLGNRVFVGCNDNGTRVFNRILNHLYEIYNDAKLFRLMAQKEYDFVQVKDKYVSGILALIAAKFFKTKFIFWLSYPFPESRIHRAFSRTAPRYPFFYFLSGLFYQFLQYKLLMPLADFVFVQSEQMKIDLEKKGISAQKLFPVPMGVQLDAIDNIFSINKTHDKVRKNRICYMGTMIKVRRLEFLIKSFAKVLIKFPELKLYMIGEGGTPEDISFLKKEGTRLGIIDSIVFTGFLPWEEAMILVKSCQICVSPFYPSFILNSTSPTKLIEYMALGRPVVANDHPEQKKIISESNGGICVPYAEDDFANAIITLLRDPQKCERMGISGRKYVEENRTYKIIADMLEKQYEKIIFEKTEFQ